MTPAARTRIAIAGAGTIGQAHIAAAMASSTVRLSAIVDPAPAAAELARRCAVPRYATLQALLEQDRPDGVVLATPNQLHVEQGLQCVAAGMPFLVEKPLATSVAAGQRLVQAVQKAGLAALVGHHRAHSPIMAKAREVVQSGQLGRLVAVQGSATFYKPADYFQQGNAWRTEPGGGPILINLIHEVHNLRMLCGEVVAVQAMASNAVRGFAVEDTVSIGLRFANGVLGSFLLSDTAASPRSWEQTARENPAYASHADEDCYVISGTNGSLAVPTMRLATYASAEQRSWHQPFLASVLDLKREDPITLQMEHFGAVLRGQATPLVSLHDGLQNLRVTEAIAQAAATGTTIPL